MLYPVNIDELVVLYIINTPSGDTLLVSLSGTFRQTLLELVMPLKGHLILTSAQLFTDAVSALRKVWVLIRLWKQHSV